MSELNSTQASSGNAADAFVVTVAPAGGQFSCTPGQSVLEAGIAAGYWLPHSCRNGTCKSCCIPLLEGAVSYPEPTGERAEIPAGQCMTCQARPLSALRLEAPSVGAEPGQRVVKAALRVLEVERPSSDVVVVRAQAPANAGFNFQAGQYADVLLRDGSRRSYSMANVPNTDGMLEWHIRKMPGGKFSEHAYANLKAKDLLRFEGPFGTFTYHEADSKVILLASGTGYAPIASMLKTHGAALAKRQAVLYWGGRVMSDLYALSGETPEQAVASWEAQFPGIRIVPVMSEAGEEWQGRRGFVHAAVLEDMPQLADYAVYACGNPLMIDAAKTAFIGQAGLPEQAFYSDAFLIAAPAA